MPTPIEIVTIDKDIFISTLFTIGGGFMVMAVFILKLAERNIINQMNACHNKLHGEQENLKEYGHETRELVDEAHNRISGHQEAFHSK